MTAQGHIVQNTHEDITIGDNVENAGKMIRARPRDVLAADAHRASVA